MKCRGVKNPEICFKCTYGDCIVDELGNLPEDVVKKIEYNRAQCKLYYQRHREERLARLREPEVAKARYEYLKKWRAENRERALEQQKRYHARHREEIKKKQAEYYQAHREERIRKQAEYYRTHREEILEKMRESNRRGRDDYKRVGETGRGDPV